MWQIDYSIFVASSPPLKALGIRCLFSFFGFKQRVKEEPRAHLETIPLLFIALMPACTSQHLFRDYFHGNEDHIQCRGHKSSSP